MLLNQAAVQAFFCRYFQDLRSAVYCLHHRCTAVQVTQSSRRLLPYYKLQARAGMFRLNQLKRLLNPFILDQYM